MREQVKFTSVDQYLTAQSPEVTRMLNALRKCIKQAAPKAEEGISYNMPAYKQNGALVYFAAYAHHIGFYPTPSAIKKFSAQLKDYPVTKGGIRFSLNEPLPLELISKMVKFKVEENQKAS